MSSVWYVIGSFHAILQDRLSDLVFDPSTQARALALRDSLLARLNRIDQILQSYQEPRPTVESACRALERVSRLYHVLSQCRHTHSELTPVNAILFGPPRLLQQIDQLDLPDDNDADDDAVNQDLPVDDTLDTAPSYNWP